LRENYFFTDTPEGWNRRLLKKCGYGLHEFSYCLAYYLRDPDFKFQYPLTTDPPKVFEYKNSKYYEDLRGKIRKKKREKSIILKVEDLSDDERSYKLWCLAAPDNLSEHLDEISKEIRRMQEELLDRPIWRRRGRPEEIKNIIAGIYAQVILLKDGRTDWYFISWLLNWFWNCLKETCYHEDLEGKDPYFMYYNLRSECYRIMKNPNKENEIENAKEFFFPNIRKRKPVRIEFRKYLISIDKEDDKRPLIVFPNGMSFKEDNTLREAAAALKMPSPKKKRKKEVTITLYVTKDDYRALMKYEELRKDGNKEISLKRIWGIQLKKAISPSSARTPGRVKTAVGI